MIGIMTLGGMLIGASAVAADTQYHPYYFTLETSASGYSEICEKKSSYTCGRVSVTEPEPFGKKVHFNFTNRGYVAKSESTTMMDIGTAYLDYSVGVTMGDDLRLHAWNVTTENKGKQITVGGKFRL